MLSPPSTRPSGSAGRRSSAFVRKDSETAAFGSSPAASGPDHRRPGYGPPWEVDLSPGERSLELSPTHGAIQERLLKARRTRADPRSACSAGRTGGPLHAVLVTHPPRLRHEQAGGLNERIRELATLLVADDLGPGIAVTRHGCSVLQLEGASGPVIRSRGRFGPLPPALPGSPTAGGDAQCRRSPGVRPWS
jgi:hypothetical protein